MALGEGATVVVADDHPPTREVVTEALTEGGFQVVATAATAEEAVAACLATTPKVALLDIRMPGNGISAARAITAAGHGTRLVMLTVSEDDEDLFAALRAGASGYLVKGLDPARLAPALWAVLAGEAALPGTLVARLVAEFRTRERRRALAAAPRESRLTDREWEVLDALAEGLDTAQIAARLFVAKVTVRTHVAAILRKLGVPDRPAAVRLLRQGTP